MTLQKLVAIAAFCLPVFTLAAQAPKAPDNWFTRDMSKDNVQGTSSDEALKMLKEKGKEGKTVIVAVLDSGVDYKHEDLKDVMWTNPGEIAGNGKDDDGNGYIDDIHGWNFLGGKDGKNVDHETLELTREYVRLSKRFKDTDPKNLYGPAKDEYKYYEDIKSAFESQLKDIKDQKEQTEGFFVQLDAAIASVKAEVGKTTITNEDIAEAKKSTKTDVQASATLLERVFGRGMTIEGVEDQRKEANDYFASQLNYNLNPDYNPRSVVGDNPEDLTSKIYGNNDYRGPDASHGTHVAGIIAATRDNGVGINGIAPNVRIMSVRCVPDGDERDKDVANAIYYAVNNGASIINMSFGKGYSPQKAYVDAAMQYAADHDVLLVHAAGNDSENNDSDPNFPNDEFGSTVKGQFKKGKNVATWVEIGALSWKPAEKRVAPFSNYGKKNVDLFSPGVDLNSTIPDNKYAAFSGTSMASPAAAGVAAVLRSYYPGLSAVQVKNIMMESVTKSDEQVVKPGTKDEKVAFSSLSVTGGVVNTTNAVVLAEKTKGKKVKKALWRDAAAKVKVAMP